MIQSHQTIYELLRHFELRHGKVDPDWTEMTAALESDAIVAFADAQTVVLSENYLSPQDPEPCWSGGKTHFSDQELASLREFFASAVTEQFLVNMVATAQADGCASIPNPLGRGEISSDLSVCSDSVVFLRFASGDDPIYLIQHNFAVEALYFPIRGCVIGLRDCLAAGFKLRLLLWQILRRSQQYVHYYSRPRRVWDGLYAGNGSPFHYFNFVVPGFQAVFVENALLPPKCLHALATEHFMDIPAAFQFHDIQTAVHEDHHALTRNIWRTGTFIFGVGLRPEFWKSVSRHQAIDESILQHACAQHCDDPRLAKADIILSAGVSNSKRAWLEEQESLLLFVNEVARRYQHVVLLLDGWTCTLAAPVAANILEEEMATVAEIRGRVPANVECISLVGATCARKIAFASLVDFFITSHGTASMYVARFARRPGVSHISNAARESVVNQHLHTLTSLVPAAWVTDVAADSAQNVGRVSYRIDPKQFAAFAWADFERKVGTVVQSTSVSSFGAGLVGP